MAGKVSVSGAQQYLSTIDLRPGNNLRYKRAGGRESLTLLRLSSGVAELNLPLLLCLKAMMPVARFVGWLCIVAARLQVQIIVIIFATLIAQGSRIRC